MRSFLMLLGFVLVLSLVASAQSSPVVGKTASQLLPLAGDPTCVRAGQVVYNTAADAAKVCNNALSAVALGGGGGVSNNVTLTLDKCVIGFGTTVITIDANCSLDGSGNLIVTSVTANTGIFSGSNGGINGTEGTGAGLSAAANHDLIIPLASIHRWIMNNNNVGNLTVMGAPTTASTQGDICIFAASGYDCADSGVKFTALRDNLTNSSGQWDWTPVDSTVFYYQEEFFGGAQATGQFGQNGWTIGAIVSCSSAGQSIAGTWPHLGIMQNKMPATSGDGCYLEAQTVGAFDMTTNTNWDSKWVFDFNPTGNTTTNVGMYIGFLKPGDNSAPPTNGIYLRYDNPGDTNWTAVCRSGGVDSLPSGTPTWTVAANVWRTVRIQSTVAGTVVFTLYDASGAIINNSAASPTTTISSGCPTTALVPGSVIITRTTTAMDLYHDFFAMKVRGMTR